MCGIHTADGTPVGHDHRHGHAHGHQHRDGPLRLFRPTPPPVARRAFLGQFGKGTLALAIVTPLAAACGGSTGGGVASTATPAAGEPSSPAVDDTPETAEPTSGPVEAASPAPDDQAPAGTTPDDQAGTSRGGGSGDGDDPAAAELRWAEANLGFVSAYVLTRGNTAAIVDTGIAGSATSIGRSLESLGLNYSDVAHVILTHNHADHAGSIAEVVAQSPNATVYAGEADISGVEATDIVGLRGGEDVFGFEMVATPGHTAGHMCVYDRAAGVLVAGDALFAADGGVAEAPERFTRDVPQSRASIAALAALTFNTLLPGHGGTIEGRADTAVAALAASLA